MWKTARYLLVLVCLLYTVSCHETNPGHYLIVLRDDVDTQLHEHIAWVNDLNRNSSSGHHGVQRSYDCPIGKGYFAHISGKTAKEIEQSDEVLHIVPQSTWSLASVPSEEDIIVDDKIDPKNWALTAISSNPPKAKGPYKYHTSSATGTYIYIVDTGIQSDDPEFEGRVINGWGYTPDGDLDQSESHGEMFHGTFVAGIAGGRRHGVAKNTTLVDVKIGYDKAKSDHIWDNTVVDGLCWTANDIKEHKRAKKAVVNLSLSAGDMQCEIARHWVKNLAEGNVTVVIAAGNDGEDVKSTCLGKSRHAIHVGAYDNNFNAAAFSNHGTGIDIWAPGAGVRSVLSQAVLKRTRRGWGWPDDKRSGTSFAAPHVSGVIAGWMAEEDEGLFPSEVRQKIKELSFEGKLGDGDFHDEDVPEEEWEYRLANNRIIYNGADGVPKVIVKENTD
ncbi:unnamed protein product [Clonostachys byssicola]|uniref:Peptidase S8/S53 domain-containing protein n=1 Tax=Clonostachys byssicola TaxID=160290 RepID=A0A9N9UIY1_9HYPO|nr:unnamed protein product [Clonostachys byssicola]